MWRRVLLAAAALSYLICVLIMSGMQKEDLDVSMLGKLQRYNVNFEDINNEEIRQQCFSRNSGFTTDDQKDIIKNDVSTTQHQSTITAQDPLSSVSLNMDSVINYLNAREKSVKNLDETTTETITSTSQEMITRITENTDNQSKVDMDLIRRYILLQTNKKSFYKLDDNSETTKLDTTINLKKNERNSNVLGNITLIDKLIKSYLFKKQLIPTSTEYITTRNTIDMQNIYKRIDEFIAKSSDMKNIEGKMVTNNSDNGRQSRTKYNVISPEQVKPLSQKGPYQMEKRLLESFYNFLSEINQFRNVSSQSFPINDDSVYSKDKMVTEKLSGTFNQTKQEKETITNQYKFEKELNQKALTPSLIKEIAETVKKVIFKDLRNELADIYLKTTQTNTQATTTETTSETSTVTTSNNKIQERDKAIMDKFMDLYEQIKSLKQTTFLLRANNESVTIVSDLKQQIKSPIKNTRFMPAVNTLQIAEPKTFISSVGNYNTQHTFSNYNTHPRKENHRIPLTIQTNSVEIQPLAVPISKPESLIRQNIVVQSGYRFRDSNDKNLKPFISRGNIYSDVPKKHNNKTLNPIQFNRYEGYNSARYPIYNTLDPKPREDVIRFRVSDNGNARLDTDYYEKINFGNDRNGDNAKRGIFTNRNIPRFHERLEGIDTGSDGMPVSSDNNLTDRQEQSADFPSRHQLSLVDMKKGTSYDETHFKNFLKTQQKVTDMLERILATRPKTNTPRSVEAI